MTFDNGAVFNNYGSVTGYGYFEGLGDETVNNYGSWTLTQNEYFNIVTFNVNGGTVNVGASQLEIYGAGSSVGGTFTTSTNGVIDFDNDWNDPVHDRPDDNIQRRRRDHQG